MSDDNDVLLTTVLPNYLLYHADRVSRGGGCAILVNNTFVLSFANICVEDIKSLWVELRLSFKVSVLLGCVYRRPTCDIINLQTWFDK